MNKILTAASALVVFASPSLAQTPELQGALQSYGAAWASRDVDKIVSLHTKDSEFRLFVEGTPVAQGRDEIAEQFSDILTSIPTYQSSIDSVRFGADFVVLEYRIRMDPDAPVRLGARVFAPTGSHYEIDAIDLIEFENGLVSRKHTFVDAEALHNASSSVTSALAE